MAIGRCIAAKGEDDSMFASGRRKDRVCVLEFDNESTILGWYWRRC